MTIGLQQVVRSEVEGGLTGPANPIPYQSIDCGCGQMPLPKLARYATRRIFVILLCWVGFVQGALCGYFLVTGDTIARRFRIDPNLMNWILVISETTPFIFGLPVGYWGDRIHRAAWTGALTLLQSSTYITLIIVHFTNRMRVVEETNLVTHMSLYSDETPELCDAITSKIKIDENGSGYVTIVVLMIVQIFTGLANIGYYALGVSYLDDNTKKNRVAGMIGAVLSVKIVGLFLGYILAWECLRLDGQDLSVIESYKEQIGAWWLGFPILGILLCVPALFLAWFPRLLPSEVIELAASSLLNRSDRSISRRRPLSTNQKVGSPYFLPSLIRLMKNKILMCNIFAYVFCITAIVNFTNNENSILESRFYIPKPIGMLMGFNDPLASRLVINILKPIFTGLIVIISGLVICKGKFRARFLAGYNLIIVVLSGLIIFSLSFVICNTPTIVGTAGDSLVLTKACNRDCRCSEEANFRPVCDNRGMYTFYSPCHAGCTIIEDTDDVKKIFTGCSCVEFMTGWGNNVAKDGPCDSNKCQTSWILFQLGSMLAYVLTASGFVGDILINLRSVNKQDKAVCIGLWMTLVALFVNVPGKFLYNWLSDKTCRYPGKQNSICHLHDGGRLGDYLCYSTASLLLVSSIFRFLVWVFTGKLRIYNDVSIEEEEANPENTREMQSLTEPVNNEEQTTTNEDQIQLDPVEIIEESPRTITTQTEITQLKELPPSPGSELLKVHEITRNRRARMRNHKSDDETISSSDDLDQDLDSRVAYQPLKFDSDTENDYQSKPYRKRNRRKLPNPDNYEDPRLMRKSKIFEDRSGLTRTDSFEYKKERGDYQKDVKALIDRYEKRTTSQEALNKLDEDKIHKPFHQGVPLVAMVSTRPSSRGQTSSGFGSLLDDHDKNSDISSDIESSPSPKEFRKSKKPALCTDL